MAGDLGTGPRPGALPAGKVTRGPSFLPTATSPRSPHAHPPTVLLVASLRWPIAARLGLAFAELGCRVEVVCPRGHPARRVRSIARLHRYSIFDPCRSLHAAILACEPDLVIPCDDPVARRLCDLYAAIERTGPGDDGVRGCIGRSLGVPGAHPRVAERGRLATLAAELGIRTPATGSIETPDDLERWLERHGYPAVLKLDATWGGQGVVIANDRTQAQRAFDAFRSRPPLRRAAVRALLERDPGYVLRAFARRPAITVQQFIPGTPANRAVACWHGRVVAGTSVEAMRTQHATGPATVVRLIDHPEMAAAADRLVRHLGVTGLWGLDFVIDANTQAAYLVEVNPRATPICHLPFANGRPLAEALYAMMTAALPASVPARIDGAFVAMFPGEWRRDAASPYLSSAHHDVPWREPGLVRDGIEGPWAERGLLARLWAEWRQRIPSRTARRGPTFGGAPPARAPAAEQHSSAAGESVDQRDRTVAGEDAVRPLHGRSL